MSILLHIGENINKLDHSISDTDSSSREYRTRLSQPELQN